MCAVSLNCFGGTDLRLSSNGRYLETTDGTPFYWMGDTAWCLATRLNRADTEFYLNNRQNKGINVIQTIAHPWAGFGSGYGPAESNPANAYGHRPFTGSAADPNTAVPAVASGGGPDSPNDYWDHMDFIVRETKERGMHLALVPIWGRKYINAYSGADIEYTESEARAFGEFLGARYKNEPHIIWLVGGDSSPTQGSDKRPVYRALAEGIVKGVSGVTVAYNQSSPAWDTVLICYHPPDGGLYFGSEPWVDFYMLQSLQNQPNNVPSFTSNAYGASPVKPVVMGESLYEGMIIWDSGYDGNSPVEVRRSIYQTWFCGGKGYTYGCHDTTLTSQDNVYGFGTGGGGWKNRLDLEGSQDIPHVNSLLTTREWHKHVPDQSIITSGAGSGSTQKRASKSTAGDEILVYYPTNSSASIKNVLAVSTNAEWFDPRNGTTQSAGTFTAGQTRSMQPPSGWQDAVLILEGTTPTGQSPYGGTAVSLPGTIQAENFDNGGSGVAYHDTTGGNSGGQYRSTDVDVSTCTDSGGGYHVSYTAAGEWLEYTVNVGQTGSYNLSYRTASGGSGGSLRVEVDGVNVTGTLTTPGTSGWQNWATTTLNGVSLAAGQHVLRIYLLQGEFNLNWISFAASGGGGSGLIVDNADSTGVTIIGAWTASTGAPGYHGSNYLYDGNTGQGSKSVRFRPNLGSAGSYEVFAIWTSHANRASNAPIDIVHAGGTEYVQVNQQTDGGTWVSLGTYSFAAGTAGSVLIHNTGANGHVVADAVKFVPVATQEIVLDNSSGTGVTINGSWVTSSAAPGYLGANYLHDGNTGKGSKSVRFTPGITAAGSYQVLARWTSGSNRASNVPIDIVHAGGTAQVQVNQQANGGQWVSLGSYNFNAGTAGSVLIGTAGTNGYVIADAVKFIFSP